MNNWNSKLKDFWGMAKAFLQTAVHLTLNFEPLRRLRPKLLAWGTPHRIIALSGITGCLVGMLAIGLAITSFLNGSPILTCLSLIFGGVAAHMGAKIAQRAIAPIAPSSNITAQNMEEAISQLNTVRSALLESETRHRDLLNSQDDVIMRCNALGELTYVNAAYGALFKVDPMSVIGRAYKPNIIDGDETPDFNANMGPARQHYKQKIASVDGAQWFAFEQLAIRDDQGGILEIQTIGRNISKQKETEQRLQSARDEAEAANKAKGQFLATMSHELRTPMNGILGMTNMLYDTELTQEQRSYAELIDTSAKSLLVIINQVLDFSKIEAGKLELQSYPFHIRDVVQNVVELLAPRAYDKDLDLGWYIDPNLPQTLIGDEVRIRQILTNLIDNAIKFTNHGGISIEVQAPNLSQQADSPKTLEILVRDTGIGLSKKDKTKIFGKFEQAEGAHARLHEGSGLGLAIVREIAEQMNGGVRVESEKGKGSTFTVTIQVECQGDTGKLYQSWELPEKQNNVLITGCHPIEVDLIARSMEMVGLKVTTATPKTIVRKINEAGANGKPFDTLIVSAPDFDQYGTNYVRAMKKTYTSLAIKGQPNIIVTMDSSKRGSFETYKNEGAQAYLTRPIRASSLFARLNAKVNTLPDTKPAPKLVKQDLEQKQKQPIDTEARFNILLAEDNEINALLMKNMLGRSQCATIHAETGRQAMEQLRTIVETNQKLDLILMDINMPEMDGYETTSAMRAYLSEKNDPAYSQLPIIAVTANSFPEDKEKCLQNGFDDHLPKPFGKDQLEQILSKWTIGRELQDEVGTPSQTQLAGK